MKILHFITIIVSVFFISLLTSHVYAQCNIVNGTQTCLGMNPVLTSIKSDRLVYENSDKPVITITGVPHSTVNFEIENQSGNIVFSHSIELPSTGIANYTLDISSYKSGLYTAVASTFVNKVTSLFRIGLITFSGPVSLSMEKYSYLPNDKIIMHGVTEPDSIVQLSLIDPNGSIVKSLKKFSDHFGNFYSSDFSIPPDAISGIWSVTASSGVNTRFVDITVNSTLSSSQNYTSVTNDHHYEQTNMIHPKSPLEQFKSHVPVREIKCNGTLTLMVFYDGYPICVTQTTGDKLEQRGLAMAISETMTVPSIISPDKAIEITKSDLSKHVANLTDVAIIGTDTKSKYPLPLFYENPNGFTLKINYTKNFVITGCNPLKNGLCFIRDKTVLQNTNDRWFYNIEFNFFIKNAGQDQYGGYDYDIIDAQTGKILYSDLWSIPDSLKEKIGYTD